ncbi:peptide deformylase [Candidatus Falkowbacteria bacterium RBG_13_39_14]|uniref:Peptide deformylase n=1 Tax=Candidatus Falkowbacteria bacterium RBG_13_39_14 TaxID=1797985 RepID=A0A1F5S387_9BACT|nr:MAG: peptide deformylase [Candidatus Falkowbacteria bacterium RBG_13_39_14]
MRLNIITTPNPILRQKAKEIKKDELDSKKFRRLVSDMVETMREKNGIGLAAPQAGENARLICIDARETDQRGRIEKEKYPELIYNESNLVIINPSITWKSFGKTVIEEGCLSIPKVTGNIKRSKSIRMNCMNLEGKKIKIKTKGLLARVLQHEIDHLEGILFTDRI